jgi:D-alanine-D-alanine ligase
MMEIVLMLSPQRVLVVYDLPEPVAQHENLKYLVDNEDRPTERDVVRTLKKLGHEVFVHGIYDDVSSLWKKIHDLDPDVVFNLCETFYGDRTYEGDVASLLSLSKTPFTGSSASALHVCKDKGMTKKIAVWEGASVPAFAVFAHDDFRFNSFECEFPLIVKPLNREASEGISQASIVYDWSQCEERAKWVATKLKTDVIVEEFIHGRELYVAVLETENGVIALPPRELFFANLGKQDPMVATYKAKWDDDYRSRWGISTAQASELTAEAQSKLQIDSVQLFKSLGLKGYARVDWRMNEKNDPILLEVNPNPALSIDDDFAKSAKSAGINYGSLINEILKAALKLESKGKAQAYGHPLQTTALLRAQG